MPRFDEWKQQATQDQFNFALNLGDRTWDKYAMPEDNHELWLKIAFALAGPPRSEDRRNAYGYTKDQQERINDLKEKCISYCKKQGWRDVYIAFIFVLAWKPGTNGIILPLIRVKYGEGKDIRLSDFFDHTGRHYSKWSEFLEDNVFAGWWICLPERGQYTFSSDKKLLLDFVDQTKRGQVVEVLDFVSTATGVTSSLAMAAGLAMTFFPPTALFGAALITSSTICGAPAAVYGVGRSAGKIIDRAQHEQTINPFASSEARASWLTVSASLLSLGTMASSRYLVSTARAANMAGSGMRVFCTALNVTALSLNGLGVLNAVYEVSKKEKVSGLDILQLSTSILFFTHSLVNFKTASAIIKDAQNEMIAAERRQLSPENQKAFDAMQEGRQEMYEPGKRRPMHGNNEFIRDLKKIDNKQDYFKAFNLVEGNQLLVHGELNIDAKAFLQTTDQERNIILENCEKYNKNEITIEEFNRNIKGIKQEYRIAFECHRRAALDDLRNKFQLENRSLGGNNDFFKHLEPHEIDRLHSVMTQAGANYNQKYIEVGHTIAELAGCKNVTEYTAVFEYAIRRMHEMAKDLKPNNPNTNCKVLAANQILDNKDNAQNRILNDFANLRAECDRVNVGQPRFDNSMAAANHYDKHPLFPQIDPNNPVTAERYFAIATEMTEGPMKNPKWTQDGSSLMCQFYSDKYGAVAVRYDNLPDGTSVIATLMSQTNNRPIGQPQLRRI